ncbi:carboxylesterase [Ammoniphilus sp. CFH 90114]|uniref:alpha/beta hydrolase n=1 Tax=Ammoniphilus sp. CFH 90114 TaxID=2493665 RepID=UPI00100F2D6A|nr:alpha/beta fold hydrolase [Ammoniphilus sp. CFH 90114]RXT04049.1 alpha/beta fold hydrolase [Ammoniphilus sp. CFH 90114]
MTGCLLLHGFTGSPYEVEPLADHLRKHGWKISMPTLPGHGHLKEDMKKVTWKDWIQKAEEELRLLLKECSVVYVVGFSMGGMIAAYLSTKYPVTKLVLLNACVYYINPGQMFSHMAEAIKSNFTADSKDLMKRYMQKSLSTPVRAVVHFRRLVKVLKPELAKVTVPTLILQGECDDLVEPRSAHYIYQSIQSTSKEIHFLPQSKHILCHDCESDQVVSLVEEFLTREPEGADIRV